MNNQELSVQLKVGADRVKAIAKHLNFTSDDYTDEQIKGIEVVVTRMRELDTGSITQAIASLRQPTQQQSSGSQVEGDRVNSFTDASSQRKHQVQRLAAVQAEQSKQEINRLWMDCMINGTPKDWLTSKEAEQIESLGKQNNDAFEELVIQIIPQPQPMTASLTGKQYISLPGA